ncbi:MAG: hypothetical protein ACJ8GW_18640 [Massilia sp.]
MKTFKHILPAAFACVMLLSAPAYAAEDATHFQLSMALIQKLQAAEADMKMQQKPGAPQAEPEVDPDKSIEAAIRKVDRDTLTSAALAKNGLTSRDFVLSAHALLHAGTFVSQESTMDKLKSATLYSSYTPEQQANIDLIRKMLKGEK